jgi:uncharacterized membrane protein
MIPNQIEREIVINAPVTKVWAVLTKAEHLPRGSTKATATVDLPDEEKIARATENTGGWEEQLAEIKEYTEKQAA